MVWSTEGQEGYLRLKGLPANEPSRSQYQLWIVDPERDEFPVDGGVFDIPSGEREDVVRFRSQYRFSLWPLFHVTMGLRTRRARTREASDVPDRRPIAGARALKP